MVEQHPNRGFFAKAYGIGYKPWSSTEEVDEEAQDLMSSLDTPLPGERMLDLGCGEGRITALFAKKGFKGYGIDYIPQAISKAKELAAESGVSEQTTFLLGDVLRLPFQGDSFKVVVDSGCFHHVRKQDWPLYLHNLLRVLKKGGSYLLVTFSLKDRHSHRNVRNWVFHNQHYDHFFSQGELKDLFHPWFHILKIREIEKEIHAFYHLQMLRVH